MTGPGRFLPNPHTTSKQKATHQDTKLSGAAEDTKLSGAAEDHDTKLSGAAEDQEDESMMCCAACGSVRADGTKLQTYMYRQ